MQDLENILKTNTLIFYPVVYFDDPGELAYLDLSASNNSFSPAVFNDIELFSAWISEQQSKMNARYLVGGYNEKRTMYSRSPIFDANNEQDEEPRTLHLGLDIWAHAGTPVSAPLEGMVHSFAFNNQYGDYGATIILEHRLEEITFYTLYGHLSLRDLEHLQKGIIVKKAEPFAHFGQPNENGNWPPHLHFQVIADIGEYEGDYPGVCKPSEAEYYLGNCPDPALIFHPFG